MSLDLMSQDLEWDEIERRAIAGDRSFIPSDYNEQKAFFDAWAEFASARCDVETKKIRRELVFIKATMATSFLAIVALVVEFWVALYL